VVVLLPVVTGGATYTGPGAVVEYSVVVCAGTSAQAPSKPNDIATTAARPTWFRSFNVITSIGYFVRQQGAQVQRQNSTPNFIGP
jgi:hypothetical protein